MGNVFPMAQASYSFQATELLSERYILGGISKPVFNPLHDLESLWWLGIWFTFCHFPLRKDVSSSNSRFVSDLTKPQTQQSIQGISFIGHSLFQLVNGIKPNSTVRMQALVEGLLLLDAQLDNHKFPTTIRNFCKVLDIFRVKLVGHFLKAPRFQPDMSVKVDADYFGLTAFTMYDDLLDIFAASGLDPNSQSSNSAAMFDQNVQDYYLWPIKLLQDQLKGV